MTGKPMREFEPRGQAVPPAGATVGGPTPLSAAPRVIAISSPGSPALETFILREMWTWWTASGRCGYTLRRYRSTAHMPTPSGCWVALSRPAGSPAAARAPAGSAPQRLPFPLAATAVGEASRPRHLRHRWLPSTRPSPRIALRAQRTRHITRTSSVPATAALCRRPAGHLLLVQCPRARHLRRVGRTASALSPTPGGRLRRHLHRVTAVISWSSFPRCCRASIGSTIASI